MSFSLLYITNGINGSGGLERVLSIKASYLADKMGYDVSILVLNEAHKNPFYRFSKQIRFLTIPVKGNTLTYFFRYRKGIKNTIKTIKPDIISVCDDGLKGMLFPVFFGKKIPVIYERHASFDIFINNEKISLLNKLKISLSKNVIQWSAKKFDRFVVLTNNNLKEWNLPNMQVIPNPLSFYPKESANLTNKKVIAVGNHGYHKGFDRLLLIWKKVSLHYPDWELNIYGKKDPSKKLEKLAKQYAIRQSVHFYNPVHNIIEKYLESSLYVLSSRSEGFGMVLIEAMACGVPCVAFDCPSGPKDIIKHQEDGILVKNGDTEAFAKALIQLIENEEKRQQMGALAKENVKRYLPENVMPIWDKLFREMV